MFKKADCIIIAIVFVGLLIYSSPEAAEICEQHEFGTVTEYDWVYSNGISWDFTAVNTMKVGTIEAESVLATLSEGTFHIQIKVNNSTVTSWDETINDVNFLPYTHTATVDGFDLNAGDTITYFIYGGNLFDEWGAIRGVSSVKLCANQLVVDFVTRFYQLSLKREPEPTGLKDWVDDLLDRSKSGADVAKGFINSQEFINRNVDDDEYLQILYEAFFDRKADPGGYDYWRDELRSGKTRENVLDGFIYAQEFINLCATYGIDPFETEQDPVEAFVTRFYQECLDRDPDPVGLADWVNKLVNKILAGADVAKGFIFSPEFIAKNTSNTEYLEILYKAFFNRAADPGGWDTWLAKLNSGISRSEVLDGFIYSQEFANLCNEYGIIPFFEKTCENVAGIWSTKEVSDERDCGGGSAETEYMTYSISQNGCNISVTNTTYGVGPFSGIVDGNHVSWSGQYPEDGGTTTANIGLDFSGNSMTGSATWTWSGNGEVCSGTSQVTGTRN